MNEDVLKDLKARIDKTLDDLKKELGKIREKFSDIEQMLAAIR